jgi:sugar O-acyltransferase (sialic acid O-acetyltransferase NeuD family)
MAKASPLLILGATGFPEVAQVIRDAGKVGPAYEVIGILDDDESLHGSTVEGVKVFGPLDTVRLHPSAYLLLAIGSHRSRITRYQILERLHVERERFATIVHPSAVVYPSAKIGKGCVVYPGAAVFHRATLADHVLVLPNTIVGVGTTICEGAMLTSLVSTTANVFVGPYSHLGTLSAIAEGVKIGPGAQVGMGSVVLRDLPAGCFCLGNPAKVIGKIDVPPGVLAIWEVARKSASNLGK